MIYLDWIAHPIPPDFGVFPLDKFADVVAPTCEYPNFVISFELVQPISPRYINVRNGQTGGHTDRPVMTPMMRFVQRASLANCWTATTWYTVTAFDTYRCVTLFLVLDENHGKKCRNHGTLSNKSQNSRRIHGHLLILKCLIDNQLFICSICH